MLNKKTVEDLVRNWWLNPKKNVYRIHLSHTDMDGYGCQMVTDYAANYLWRQIHNMEKNTSHKIQRLTNVAYANVGYNIDDQQAALEKVVSRLINYTEYTRGSSLLSILVTDLSRFNPDEVFAPLIKDGHIIHYIVVDHHVDTNGIGDSEQSIRVTMHEGSQYVSCWATFPEHSATKLLCDALTISAAKYTRMADKYYYYSRPEIEKMNTRISTTYAILKGLANAISQSDLGDWGSWVTDNWEGIDTTAAVRFGWNFFSRYPQGPEHWLDFMKNWVYGPDHASTFWHDQYWLIAENEWHKVMSEYTMFKNGLHKKGHIPAYPETDVVMDYVESFGYEARLLILEKNEDGSRKFPSFFMLSKEALVTGADNQGGRTVDIIVGYSPDENKYSICSESDQIDCAKIAAHFGGGGHPHAAGFPTPSTAAVED